MESYQEEKDEKSLEDEEVDERRERIWTSLLCVLSFLYYIKQIEIKSGVERSLSRTSSPARPSEVYIHLTDCGARETQRKEKQKEGFIWI